MSAVASKFEIGDRVVIRNLPCYIPLRRQGLIVGNTGTVIRVGPHAVELRTDCAEDSTNGSIGWGFHASDLQRVGGLSYWARRLTYPIRMRGRAA